jgi:nicotinamide mononucleotide (NMN) deamidase PncC
MGGLVRVDDTEQLTESLTQVLAKRQLTLGTVESGVDGAVSRQIFAAEEGPAVLGTCLIVDELEQAIGLMDLPRPQFKKAGDFSAKAARAAAREGRAFLGVDLCLAVWVEGGLSAGRPVYLAVATSREVTSQALQIEEPAAQGVEWVVHQALTMLEEALA